MSAEGREGILVEAREDSDDERLQREVVGLAIRLTSVQSPAQFHRELANLLAAASALVMHRS